MKPGGLEVAVSVPAEKDSNVEMLQPLPEDKEMTVTFAGVSCWVSRSGRRGPGPALPPPAGRRYCRVAAYWAAHWPVAILCLPASSFSAA